MNNNSILPLRGQKEKPSLLIEVIKVEKQLLALIHTKGLLHSDVQNLYRKICSSYEKIILNDHELAELQDVEYSLWKLHYRHIDEFRKTIKKSSANDETTKLLTPQTQSVVAAQRGNGNHAEGLKSFLLEATEFYQNLISKVKRFYGLPEDFSFYKKGGNSSSVEAKKVRKLQFLCHRLLVCLGDIARYSEKCEKSDEQKCNWSVAVTHYLEAAMIWPDSGNPQNQLAVLATYVGDEFLALYHCIRSLAVKDPFPDAWNNLILLFERNRSSHLDSLSSEAQFDFLKPSERSGGTKSQSTNDLSNGKMVKTDGETNLWPLIIRTISFFFIESSLEDFSCTFASTMRELDVLMALDDSKLNAAMESYQCMNSARSGPFRFLQVVSVFIFVIENLINSPEVKDLKGKNDEQQLLLTQLALTVAFVFMGRLVDRCLKATLVDSCPLLPALLVFVEWLVRILDMAERYGSDDKSTSAMSYFFGAFLKLLRRFDINGREIEPSGSVALWEDYELRGFAPLACSHISLDFSTYDKYADSFGSGSDCRAHRIINAAMKIADRPNNNKLWIMYDKSGRKFYTSKSVKFPDKKESEKGEVKFPDKKESEKGEAISAAVQVQESDQFVNEATEACEKFISERKPSNPHLLGKSAAMEEEEVILFKPLTRYNSAPLYGSITTNNEMPSKDAGDQVVPADECLRRATSLLIAQNQANGNPSAFDSDLTNFRSNQPLKQQEALIKDTVGYLFSDASISPGPPSSSNSISAGPPSLNAWVLNRGSLSNERVKGKDGIKHSLTPIEEIASSSLNDLSFSENEDLVISSQRESVTTHYLPHVYLAPMPSAPFLPDDAVWFNGVQSTLSDYGSPGSINRTNYSFDSPQVGGYSNWTGSHQPADYGAGISGFVDGYAPARRMTSSEWLRQYRESHNLERATNHIWPAHSYAAGNTGNFQGYDVSRPDLFDQWGTPVASNSLIYEESWSPPLHPGFPHVYSTDEHRREKLFYGYQRPNTYGCGVVNEPEPLLHYLKEKEWLLQQDPTLRGPAFMGR